MRCGWFVCNRNKLLFWNFPLKDCKTISWRIWNFVTKISEIFSSHLCLCCIILLREILCMCYCSAMLSASSAGSRLLKVDRFCRCLRRWLGPLISPVVSSWSSTIECCDVHGAISSCVRRLPVSYYADCLVLPNYYLQCLINWDTRM